MSKDSKELRINKDTVLCISLAGRPGNFGTRFHNFLYERLGLNFLYKAFTTKDLSAAISGLRALEIRGCAVSMPFKVSCIEFLDELEASAHEIGSVNTIVNTDGKLKGFNTDYTAVHQLLRKIEIPPPSEFALTGSGGMARSVASALHNLGFKNGVIVARNEHTGKALAEKYGFNWVPQWRGETDLLINASPIGMAGSTEAAELPFLEEQVLKAQAVIDVAATARETPLIQIAIKHGKAKITGFDITVLQALEQFYLYTGVRPDHALAQEAAAFANSTTERHRPL